jgi:hypothetical protein
MKTGVFKRIDSRDRSITPFKVYKSYQFTSTSSMDSEGLGRLTAIKPNPKLYAGGAVTLFARQTVESASALINHYVSKSASEIYYSIDHLYYKRPDRPYENFGYSNSEVAERKLYNNATVISVPQKKFGERIKANSVKFIYTGSLGDTTTYTSAVSFSLSDDGYGNLIDNNLPSKISDEIFYLGFNDLTYNQDWLTETSRSIDFESKPAYPTDITANKYYITSSFITDVTSIGNSIKLLGSGSYLRVNHIPDYQFGSGSNFAFSFWFKNDLPADDLYRCLVSKCHVRKSDLDPAAIVNKYSPQFPIDIIVKTNASNQTVLGARCSDGSSLVQIFTTLANTDPRHLVFQKSGSNISLYIDGSLVETKSIGSLDYITNNNDIVFGNRNITPATLDGTKDSDAFIGELDEIFIFNKALSTTEISTLYNTKTLLNTPAVGNVFYEHGIVVISDPRKLYSQTIANSDTGAYFFGDKLTDQETLTNQSKPGMYNTFLFEYNATQTLYEHEFLCKIAEDEFNFTMNPTIRKNNDPNSEMPKEWVIQNDTFGPYITTVGLYDDAGQLLAVGKLSSPIKKRDSVETNIIVRFDI